MNNDYVKGIESVVDKAIKLNEKIKELKQEFENCKQKIREVAEQNIEIDGTYIKIAGSAGKSVSVVLSNKRKVVIQSGFKPETLPKQIRDLFFTEVTSYEPIDVDLFEKNLDMHPEFDDKFTIVYHTSAVKF